MRSTIGMDRVVDLIDYNCEYNTIDDCVSIVHKWMINTHNGLLLSLKQNKNIEKSYRDHCDNVNAWIVLLNFIRQKVEWPSWISEKDLYYKKITYKHIDIISTFIHVYWYSNYIVKNPNTLYKFIDSYAAFRNWKENELKQAWNVLIRTIMKRRLVMITSFDDDIYHYLPEKGDRRSDFHLILGGRYDYRYIDFKQLLSSSCLYKYPCVGDWEKKTYQLMEDLFLLRHVSILDVNDVLSLNYESLRVEKSVHMTDDEDMVDVGNFAAGFNIEQVYDEDDDVTFNVEGGVDPDDMIDEEEPIVVVTNDEQPAANTMSYTLDALIKNKMIELSQAYNIIAEESSKPQINASIYEESEWYKKTKSILNSVFPLLTARVLDPLDVYIGNSEANNKGTLFRDLIIEENRHVLTKLNPKTFIVSITPKDYTTWNNKPQIPARIKQKSKLEAAKETVRNIEILLAAQKKFKGDNNAAIEAMTSVDAVSKSISDNAVIESRIIEETKNRLLALENLVSTLKTNIFNDETNLGSLKQHVDIINKNKEKQYDLMMKSITAIENKISTNIDPGMLQKDSEIGQLKGDIEMVKKKLETINNTHTSNVQEIKENSRKFNYIIELNKKEKKELNDQFTDISNKLSQITTNYSLKQTEIDEEKINVADRFNQYQGSLDSLITTTQQINKVQAEQEKLEQENQKAISDILDLQSVLENEQNELKNIVKAPYSQQAALFSDKNKPSLYEELAGSRTVSRTSGANIITLFSNMIAYSGNVDQTVRYDLSNLNLLHATATKIITDNNDNVNTQLLMRVYHTSPWFLAMASRKEFEGKSIQEVVDLYKNSKIAYEACKPKTKFQVQVTEFKNDITKSNQYDNVFTIDKKKKTRAEILKARMNEIKKKSNISNTNSMDESTDVEGSSPATSDVQINRKRSYEDADLDLQEQTIAYNSRSQLEIDTRLRTYLQEGDISNLYSPDPEVYVHSRTLKKRSATPQSNDLASQNEANTDMTVATRISVIRNSTGTETYQIPFLEVVLSTKAINSVLYCFNYLCMAIQSTSMNDWLHLLNSSKKDVTNVVECVQSLLEYHYRIEMEKRGAKGNQAISYMDKYTVSLDRYRVRILDLFEITGDRKQELVPSGARIITIWDEQDVFLKQRYEMRMKSAQMRNAASERSIERSQEAEMRSGKPKRKTKKKSSSIYDIDSMKEEEEKTQEAWFSSRFKRPI